MYSCCGTGNVTMEIMTKGAQMCDFNRVYSQYWIYCDHILSKIDIFYGLWLDLDIEYNLTN